MALPPLSPIIVSAAIGGTRDYRPMGLLSCGEGTTMILVRVIAMLLEWFGTYTTAGRVACINLHCCPG